jgi:SNF family Na+-dependent transporter
MLATLAGANFWSVIFFIMLILIGIDSIFSNLDYKIHFLLDMFPVLKRIRHELFVFIVILLFFALGVIFSTNCGFWFFELFDKYSAGITLIFLCLSECILFGWVLGIDNISNLLQQCNKEKIPTCFRFVFKFILPPALIFILVLGIVLM